MAAEVPVKFLQILVHGLLIDLVFSKRAQVAHFLDLSGCIVLLILIIFQELFSSQKIPSRGLAGNYTRTIFSNLPLEDLIEGQKIAGELQVDVLTIAFEATLRKRNLVSPTISDG